MRKLLFLSILLCAVTIKAQQPTYTKESGSLTVLDTSGARAVSLRIFFSSPFITMPSPGCVIEITKPGFHAHHGMGEIKEHSPMWVQIYAEVGEQITWTCRGTR